MSSALQLANNAAQDWLANLDTRPVAAAASIAQLRETIFSEFPQQGLAADKVIADLINAAQPGLLGSGSGRFFAWVIGGCVESALAADWLVSAWDQNAVLGTCGPAVCVIEEITGAWIKQLLDLPREASFAFTTGCQMAHATAMAAARSAVLQSVGWDCSSQGLFNAPAITLIMSQEKHASVIRAANFLGFGSVAIKQVPSNSLGQMEPADLQVAIDTITGPKIVVLNAADLNIGAYDPFAQLIPMAHAAGAWVHVDGAFGLFARASQSKRYLTDGIELADSWATDAHKWLNVPYDCGIAIIRDTHTHKQAMTISAAYLTPDPQTRDQIDWTPEWSRRARSLPVYAALRQLGAVGVEALIDRCCAMAQALADGLAKLDGVRVLWRPTLNQGLIRFECTANTPAQNDAFTDTVIAAINDTGEAYFSGTTWRGIRAMRISVVNWRTNAQDIDRTISAVATVLARLG